MRGNLRRMAGMSVVLVGLAGLVLVVYVTSTRLYGGSSDMATTVLQGQALDHGNVLLHGWILTRESYWTTETLVFALAVAIEGLRPSLLDVGPAAVVVITVVVGALVARHGRRGVAGVAGAAVVVTLLALSAPPGAASVYTPHVATALLALVAFAGLSRGRVDWRWAAAVAVLVAGVLGDLLIVAYGIVPVFVAGIVTMLTERAWRPGVAAVSASVAGAVLGLSASWVARATGGFTLGPGVRFAPAHQVLQNLGHLSTYGAGLLGFTGFFGSRGVPTALEGLRFVGGLIVAGCTVVAVTEVVRAVRRGRRGTPASAVEAESRWLDSVLVVAVVGPVVTFVVLATPGVNGARYLVASFVFAAVLTGRIVARGSEQLGAGTARRALYLGGVAVSLGFIVGLGDTLGLPVAPQSTKALAMFLEAHHLRNGVGGYWAASITTVESSGAVTVRPVWAERGGTLGREMYQSSASWYASQHFQFLVYGMPPYDGVDAISATRTWGRPAHTYVLGSYRVLVWPHDVGVAPPRLSSRSPVGPS